MVTKQGSSAGRGGLFSPNSVAAGILVSPDVCVSPVVSWWIAVTSVVIVSGLVLGELALPLSPSF